MTTCPICKTGTLHPGTATVTLEREGTVIVFREVPAQVCDQCGETYHNETTTAALLDQAQAAAAAGVQADIRRFKAAA